MTVAFLKSITIQGFKSFADRLRINLEDGMSVVVGPNGCGKSNIADAIRWVLGEQSAKNLRGGRMDDVIFAGSRTRRPVGMAEVSLHFDNAAGYFPLPYEEVSVTRRVFRDGDSEFFINRTACRLRDIQELFLDTGAGREGFSVIGQGQVEQILNMKAEERRFLIEEAAGISKFRLRKKEALKKLEETELNLSRVNDIIGEVAARLEPLSRQAEAAAVFQVAERELRELEIGRLARAGREAEEKSAAAAARQEERELKQAAAAAAAAAGETARLTARLALTAAEEALKARREAIHGAETECQSQEHALALGAERGRHLSGERERLAGEADVKRERRVARQDKLAAERGRAADIQRILAAGRVQQSAWEADWAALRGAGAGRSESLKAEMFGAQSQQLAAGNEYADAEHRLAALEKEKALRLEERERREAELERNETELRALAATAAELTAAAAALTEQDGAAARQAREEETAAADLAAAERENSRRLEQTLARGSALRQLDENREGYRRGVRSIVSALRRGELNEDGFLGTVADNLSVDPAHEVAVSTALGGALQDIIVTTAARGQEYIDWLRKKQGGRATFLPLDTLRLSESPDVALFKSIRGFIGLAADLTAYPPAADRAVRFLLGRILVAEDMDAALAVARRASFRFRVVTAAGDQVNVGGSLTGGREGTGGGEAHNLLRRRREIEELDAAAAVLRVKAAELAARRRDLLAAAERRAAERDALAARRREAEKKKELLAVEQKHHEERRGSLRERLKLIDLECQEGREQRLEAENSLAACRSALEDLRLRVLALQAEQASAEESAREAAERSETLNAQITAAKVEEARQEEELRQLEAGIAEAEGKNRRDEQEILTLERRMKDLAREEGELTAAAAQTAEKIDIIRKNLDEWRLALTEQSTERERVSAALVESEEQTRLAQAALRSLEQEAHQEELAITRARTEAEMIWETLQNDFELDREAAALIELPPMSREQARRRVEALKEQIAGLGPVNLSALTEYPAAQERHAFLEAQCADLTAAGNALRELVARLDADMTVRFDVAFQAVNASFAQVFQELFEGGEAELVLEDPDRLLETGIHIVAQPPGKRARILSLLSGGERAFTAIALLLALLRVKPAPFCLLDEIESALDEANVKRFASYIRKLSAGTQFIIISHRRGTMEAADRLYGVTMEESGVSKLLTVNIGNGDVS
ncbi:MAG: chromosome segregation protein SMC [Gracilibacteraceae bacterium]|jgi:chromosome segregation protein|nr:chromosome segregation protein SMC [Gracilibacteraceae bacterium]